MVSGIIVSHYNQTIAMNKPVKNLFFKSEQVAPYGDTTFDDVYESIYQSIRKENAHRIGVSFNREKGTMSFRL